MTAAELEKVTGALGRALIEIRMAKNLKGAQMLADIFHNVPAQITTGSSFEQIRSNVMVKATYHGVEKHIQSWF